MRLSASFAVLVAILAHADAVLAQETGTHIRSAPRAEIPSATNMSAVDKGRATLGLFAACIVDRTPGRARAYIGIFPGTEASSKAAKALATAECFVANGGCEAFMGFDERLLRGAIFAAFYRKTFKKKELQLDEVKTDYWPDTVGQVSASANEYVALRQFSDCVVHKDAPLSRALILAPVASDRERAALAALKPYFGPCMVEGLKVEFSKAMLFGLIAESLYRTSMAAAKASGEMH